MSNSIRIKRRASGGGNEAGSPTSLKNGELAYNEVDDILYYGRGESGGNAVTIPGIAGSGAYVNRTTAQSVAGIKTFSDILKPDGGINVNSNKFTVSAADGSFTSSNGAFVVDANGHITSGEWKGSTIGSSYIANLNASKITAGEIPIARGGTGATSATAAATALGLGTGNSPTFTQVTVSGSGGFVGSGAGLTSVPAGHLTGDIDTARLPLATSTAKGAIELFNDTAQSVSANAVTTTAGKTYGIQLNSAGQAVVNVPWSDTQTPVRDITVDGHALDSGESLDLASGTNITLTESNGDVTIAAARRPVTAGGNTLTNGETLAFTAGSNITITESGGAVTIASVNDTNTFRPVQVGTNDLLASSETLHLIAGSNVTLTESAGDVTIASSKATRASLSIDVTDDVVFKNLELSSSETGASANATIKGPATLTLDPRGHGDDTGKVVIAGDLQVDGTTTSVNSTVVEIKDLAIELAYDAGTSALIEGAGIRLGKDGSGNAVHDFVYVHADTRMLLSSGLKVTGGLQNTVLTSCTIDGGTF